MKYLASFLLSVFGIAIIILFNILVMINGWGLSPVSYKWIIGVGLVANIFAILVIDIAKGLLKDS
jgi:hypothetical protein